MNDVYLQVHRVKVKETGEEGALKVQHRYVKSHSFVDIHTMDFLVRVVNYVFPQFEYRQRGQCTTAYCNYSMIMYGSFTSLLA